MSVRRVVWNEVDENLQTELVGCADEVVKIVERPVLRIDVVVIGHVIAMVLLRRGTERSDPDGVDAEALDVFEPRDDSRQIADAVVV
jgi:hypothetical protein